MLDGLIKYIEKETSLLDKQLTKEDKAEIQLLFIKNEKLVKYIAYLTILETFKMFNNKKK